MTFLLRLALLYSSVFLAIGVQVPFLPVWLAAKGLDERTIGAVLSAAAIARVIAVPLGTRAADHFANLKAALLLATTAAAISLTFAGTANRVLPILVAFSLAVAAGATALPLIETYALQSLAARGAPYGPTRLWGSVAFIVGNLGAGFLIAVVAPVNFIWVIVAAYWLVVPIAMTMPPAATPATESRPSGLFLRTPGLIAVVVASGLIQSSHSLFYGFSTLQWSQAGLDGVTIGALWAIGVVAEIILFAASGRLPAGFGPIALLAAGAAGGGLRWAAMAFDPPVAALPVLQCLHGLSFGATHLGAMQFVARAVSPSRAATAQGILATAYGIMSAIAMALSGVLYASVGTTAYVAMALLCVAGGTVTATLRRQPAATLR